MSFIFKKPVMFYPVPCEDNHLYQIKQLQLFKICLLKHFLEYISKRIRHFKKISHQYLYKMHEPSKLKFAVVMRIDVFHFSNID